ncbi:MAG: hypothetical protein FRX49_12267 [Trebouxia sp. A1-2]|nr:MAG: hypothetical protein FRX49_12267 [Trebouxia sp. A1-2]
MATTTDFFSLHARRPCVLRPDWQTASRMAVSHKSWLQVIKTGPDNPQQPPHSKVHQGRMAGRANSSPATKQSQKADQQSVTEYVPQDGSGCSTVYRAVARDHHSKLIKCSSAVQCMEEACSSSLLVQDDHVGQLGTNRQHLLHALFPIIYMPQALCLFGRGDDGGELEGDLALQWDSKRGGSAHVVRGFAVRSNQVGLPYVGKLWV